MVRAGDRVQTGEDAMWIPVGFLIARLIYFKRVKERVEECSALHPVLLLFA